MNIKEKINKNKKGLIILGVSALTVVGSTFAYFTSNHTFDTKFYTGTFQDKVVRNYTLPNTWTPGTVSPFDITVQNTGNIDMAVRCKVVETWTSENGNELPLIDDQNHTVALIDFGTDWTLDEDGYYYYGNKDEKTSLAKNATTTSLINTVTFNEETRASLMSSFSDQGKTITLTTTSAGNGYDNATYNIKIITETIQYDQADNVWGLNS